MKSNPKNKAGQLPHFHVRTPAHLETGAIIERTTGLPDELRLRVAIDLLKGKPEDACRRLDRYEAAAFDAEADHD